MKKTFMSRVFALLFPREAAFLHWKMDLHEQRLAEGRAIRARRAAREAAEGRREAPKVSDASF